MIPHPNTRQPRSLFPLSRLAPTLASVLLAASALVAQDVPRVPVTPQAEGPHDAGEVRTEHADNPPITATDFGMIKLTDEPDFAPMEDVLDDRGNIVGMRRVGNPYVLDFTGGRFEPEPGIDPDMEKYARQHPEGSVYGFVMIRGRMADTKMDHLRRLGVKLLGVHTYQSVKAEIPVERLGTLRDLPFVYWVGFARPSQKIDHILAPELARVGDDEQIEVTITPFDHDLAEARKVTVGERSVQDDHPTIRGEGATSTLVVPNGRFHEALSEAGFEFEHYDEISHSFTGRLTKARILKLVHEHWVHYVEQAPGDAVAEHDQAMTMVRQDTVRNSYPGTGVPAGIIDSGVDASPWHKDFGGMYYVYWGNALAPTDSHGTHVAGTILGNGTADKRYMGAAPATGRGGATNRFFISTWSVADSTNISNFSNNYTDTNGKISPKPGVINCSYSRGSDPNGYYGTDSTSIAFDNAVYSNRQLYVFASGNKKSTANWWATKPAVAKNVLTVGGVMDLFNSTRTLNPGNKYSSGRWGSLDFRTKPEVCAVADSLTSCKMDTTSDYSNKSGTSMATPMVRLPRLAHRRQLLVHVPPRGAQSARGGERQEPEPAGTRRVRRAGDWRRRATDHRLRPDQLPRDDDVDERELGLDLGRHVHDCWPVLHRDLHRPVRRAADPARARLLREGSIERRNQGPSE